MVRPFLVAAVLRNINLSGSRFALHLSLSRACHAGTQRIAFLFAYAAMRVSLSCKKSCTRMSAESALSLPLAPTTSALSRHGQKPLSALHDLLR
jgi:hypothetical protein